MIPKPCPFCGARARDRVFTAEKVYACANAECQCSIAWMPLVLWNNRPEETRFQRIAMDEELKRVDLQMEITRLRHWIKEEGIRTCVCTYEILREKCEGCRCCRFKEAK